MTHPSSTDGNEKYLWGFHPSGNQNDMFKVYFYFSVYNAIPITQSSVKKHKCKACPKDSKNGYRPSILLVVELCLDEVLNVDLDKTYVIITKNLSLN